MPQRESPTFTWQELDHVIRFLRPLGSNNINFLDPPEVKPCDYPEKVTYPERVPVPGLPYAIRLRAERRGAPGAPRFHATDESIPAVELAAVELAKLWKRDPRFDTDLARRHRVSADLIRKGRASPAGAAPAIIAAMRMVVIDREQQPYVLSKETLNRQRGIFRMLHPQLGTLKEVRAHLKAVIRTFLQLSPPKE